MSQTTLHVDSSTPVTAQQTKANAYIQAMKVKHEGLFDAALGRIYDKQNVEFDYDYECQADGRIFITYTDRFTGNREEMEVVLPITSEDTRAVSEVFAINHPVAQPVVPDTKWIGMHAGRDLYAVYDARGNLEKCHNNRYLLVYTLDENGQPQPYKYNDRQYRLNPNDPKKIFAENGEIRTVKMPSGDTTCECFDIQTIDSTTFLAIEGEEGYLRKREGITNASNPKAVYYAKYSSENDNTVYEAVYNPYTGKHKAIPVTCTTEGRVIEPTWIGRHGSKHCYIEGKNYKNVFFMNKDGFLEPYKAGIMAYTYNPKKGILEAGDKFMSFSNMDKDILDKTSMVPLFEADKPNNPLPPFLTKIGNTSYYSATGSATELRYEIKLHAPSSKYTKTLLPYAKQSELITQGSSLYADLATLTLVEDYFPVAEKAVKPNVPVLPPAPAMPTNKPLQIPGLDFPVYQEHIPMPASVRPVDHSNNIDRFKLYRDENCQVPLMHKGKQVIVPYNGFNQLSAAEKDNYLLVGNYIKYHKSEENYEVTNQLSNSGTLHLHIKKDSFGKIVAGPTYILIGEKFEATPDWVVDITGRISYVGPVQPTMEALCSVAGYEGTLYRKLDKDKFDALTGIHSDPALDVLYTNKECTKPLIMNFITRELNTENGSLVIVRGNRDQTHHVMVNGKPALFHDFKTPAEITKEAAEVKKQQKAKLELEQKAAKKQQAEEEKKLKQLRKEKEKQAKIDQARFKKEAAQAAAAPQESSGLFSRLFGSKPKAATTPAPDTSAQPVITIRAKRVAKAPVQAAVALPPSPASSTSSESSPSTPPLLPQDEAVQVNPVGAQ